MTYSEKILDEIKLLESDEYRKTYFDKLQEAVYNPMPLADIDKAFQTILDECVVSEGSSRDAEKDFTLKLDKKLDEQLTIIEKSVKKIFNIDLNIKIDTKTKRLEYFACIFLTEDDIRKAKKEIEEIILDEKFGYHYIQVKKAECYFQYQTFFYVKNFNGETILNGKHLTAILLHEIGHKVYLKLAYHKEKDDYYSLSINDGKKSRIAIPSNETKGKKLTELAASFITLVLVYLASTIINIYLEVSNTKEYTRIEGYSDRLAIQYGYGKEIYQFFLTIELWTKGKLTTDKSFIFTRKTDANYIRRSEMKKAIIREINDSRNSAQQIKMLKSILKFIEEIEKDAENKIYRYNMIGKKNKK